MAYDYSNAQNVTPSKTDQYGTHFTCWCKQKKDKKGKTYLEGYIWLPSGKAIKIMDFGNKGTDKKGNTNYAIDVTIFKPQPRERIDL